LGIFDDGSGQCRDVKPKTDAAPALSLDENWYDSWGAIGGPSEDYVRSELSVLFAPAYATTRVTESDCVRGCKERFPAREPGRTAVAAARARRFVPRNLRARPRKCEFVLG
jgi:hypothetical protein